MSFIRYGKEIRSLHQQEQGDLQGTIHEHRKENVPFVTAGGPQPIVDGDVKMKRMPGKVDGDILNLAEEGAVLKRLTEDGFELFIKLGTVDHTDGLRLGNGKISDPLRYCRRGVGVVCQSHPAATMQFPFGFLNKGMGGDGEVVLIPGVGDGVQAREQAHRVSCDGAGSQKLDLLKITRSPFQRLEDELNVASRWHNGFVMNAMFCEPRQLGLGDSRFK